MHFRLLERSNVHALRTCMHVLSAHSPALTPTRHTLVPLREQRFSTAAPSPQGDLAPAHSPDCPPEGSHSHQDCAHAGPPTAHSAHASTLSESEERRIVPSPTLTSTLCFTARSHTVLQPDHPGHTPFRAQRGEGVNTSAHPDCEAVSLFEAVHQAGQPSLQPTSPHLRGCAPSAFTAANKPTSSRLCTISLHCNQQAHNIQERTLRDPDL
jgi:hypothetical protein